MSRNLEERSVKISQEKSSDSKPRTSNLRINLLLSRSSSTSRKMEITYEYIDTSTGPASTLGQSQSFVQVVECLINLKINKCRASLPSASSASPKQSSDTQAAPASLYCARNHIRSKIGIV